MKCPKCGSQVPGGANSCDDCGWVRSGRKTEPIHDGTAKNRGCRYSDECACWPSREINGRSLCEGHAKLVEAQADGARTAQQKAKRYLVEYGVPIDASVPERMKLIAKLRDHWKTQFTAKPSRDWARIIVERVADGDPVLHYASKLAHDALMMPGEKPDTTRVRDLADD